MALKICMTLLLGPISSGDGYMLGAKAGKLRCLRLVLKSGGREADGQKAFDFIGDISILPFKRRANSMSDVLLDPLNWRRNNSHALN